MSRKTKGSCININSLPKQRAISKPIVFAQKYFKIIENIIMKWLTEKKVVDQKRKDKHMIEKKDIP